ncbi:hypothetical protein TGAMA5MH_10386 [Trichoderma gamsii]|uniref:Arrestin-like N-terminal domain-containing protein n=1 Tax=Trichoderma gamsii TaxID=398673 RepID=A0A2K0SWR5_9HYPO|nr:hypothetical protein TGAMA5MH_10386 [Trichoderma gamsii]
MKLNLDLQDAHQGPYLAQDRVRALFEIRGPTFHKSPRISVKFVGTMVVSFPTHVNGASPGHFTTVLFEESRKIEYRDLQWDEDAASGESIYTTPIDFQFPAEANCYCARPQKCQLPPSMDIAEPEMSVKVTYGIVVSVGRCILGPMTKVKSVAVEIPFSCTPTITSLPRSSCVLSVAMNEKSGRGYAHQRNTIMDQEHADGSCPSYSPKYSPSIKVEVLLPQPAVLIRGQPTPVRVIIHTPPDVLESGVYLRSVSMDLKSTVMTSVGMLPRTATQRRHGCSMAGAVKIDSEVFELDSGAWGNFFVMNTKPTTQSCIVRLDHAMEIVTGISIGLGSEVKYAVATFDVIVMDPPPAYEVGDAIQLQADAIQLQA